jgi:hypothetical protein
MAATPSYTWAQQQQSSRSARHSCGVSIRQYWNAHLRAVTHMVAGVEAHEASHHHTNTLLLYTS